MTVKDRTVAGRTVVRLAESRSKTSGLQPQRSYRVPCHSSEPQTEVVLGVSVPEQSSSVCGTLNKFVFYLKWHREGFGD